MKHDRKRLPIKSDYAEALGTAAYSFAYCEWQVVWCCEKIRVGSVTKIVGEEMTAGKIAKFYIDLTRNMPKSSDREELSELAKTFVRDPRNTGSRKPSSPEGADR
jgi:hypothetical protein